MKEKIMLRAKAKKLEPVVRIGKQGLNGNSLKEIMKVLEKRKLIKIKLLQGSLKAADKSRIASEIISKTNSELIDAVGNIIVIYKS